MKKSILITILLLICLATAAFAEGTLEIDDLKAEVDGDKDSNVDELGGTIEAEPGSEIEVEIKLKNTFDRDEDIDIEDVEIILTVFDIDDGDDIEVEVDEFDINQGDSERVKITFEVPLKVEDDMYPMEIEIQAEDDNGTDYDMLLEYDVEVEKEKHKLVFGNIDMSPTSVECDKLIQLDFSIVNVGRDDEEDVTIDVIAGGLDYSFTDEFDFESDPDDEDIEYSERLSIDAEGAQPGIYEILIKAKYDGSETLQKRVTATVGKCETDTPPVPTPAPVQPSEPEPSEPTSPTADEEEKDVVFQYSNPEPSQRYVMSDTTKSKDSSDMKWIIIIIITDIVLIVVGILIYMAFRKKR